MVTGDAVSACVVEGMGVIGGGIRVEHDELRAFLPCAILQPDHQQLTDAGATVFLVDDEVINVEFAAAPEAHADPEAAQCHHFLAIEGRHDMVVERCHGLQALDEKGLA